MKIHCIYGRNSDSNIYVILGENPTVIDCGTGLHNEEVVRGIKKIVDPTLIKQIILTHEHFDHCGGVKKLYDLTGGNAKIISYKNAADKIERGESIFARFLAWSRILSCSLNANKKLPLSTGIKSEVGR